MAVLAEALSVIVRVRDLEARYPGGLEKYEADAPNATFCCDGELARVGFMTSDDALGFIERLCQLGLRFAEGDRYVDIAMVHQHKGPLRHCDWLEFGRFPEGFSACRLAGGQHGGRMVAPPEWQSARVVEITRESKVRKEESRGRLDVYRDQATGTELYVGRPFRRSWFERLKEFFS
jgi:hypothetical protein